MKDTSETVTEAVKYLGQSFLLAYYLPALIFTLTHLYIVVPALARRLNLHWEATNKVTLPLLGKIDFATLLNTFLWSLIVAVVLFVLNAVLIRMFEGKPRWLGKGLLSFLTKRNRIRSKNLYGELARLRQEHLKFETEIQQNDRLKLTDCAEKLENLRNQINQLHKHIEELPSYQALPHDLSRVCPTSFGNAYAIAEEYFYEQYGADSVLFWPRLRVIMYEKEPSYSLRITQQKVVLDLSINFAFFSGLLTVEIILILVFLDYKSWLLVLAGVTFILSISFYRASVAAVQGLGELIKVSFDYYRGLVLQAFNLRVPDNLSEEQAVWVKLATFIRRGDAFYFPEEYRDVSKESNVIEEKQKDE